MPFAIKKTKQCPSSKPWGIVNTDTGDARGRCYPSHDAALPQHRLLEAKLSRGELSRSIGGLVKDTLARLKTR